MTLTTTSVTLTRSSMTLTTSSMTLTTLSLTLTRLSITLTTTSMTLVSFVDNVDDVDVDVDESDVNRTAKRPSRREEPVHRQPHRHGEHRPEHELVRREHENDGNDRDPDDGHDVHQRPDAAERPRRRFGWEAAAEVEQDRDAVREVEADRADRRHHE